MIDPSILLETKAPQIETPLDAQTQAAQVHNLGNVGQLQQGEIAMQPGALKLQAANVAAAEQENQQRQLALDNQQATNAAIAQNIKTSPDGKPFIDHAGVVDALTKSGKGTAAMAYQQSAAAVQKGITEQAEANAKLTTAHQQAFGSVAGAVDAAPPAAKGTLYHMFLQSGLANQQIQPGDWPADYDPSLDARIKAVSRAGMTPDQQAQTDAAAVTAKSKADEDARKANQEYSGMIADAYGGVTDQASLDNANKLLAAKIPALQLNQLVTQYGPQVQTIAQSTLTAKDRADAAEKAKALQNTQSYQANELGVRRQEVGIQNQRLAVDKAAADPWGALHLNPNPMGGGAAGGAGANGAPLTGDAFLATLPPQMAATVKAVAEGRQTNLPRGGKELDQLMGAVNAYDPTYSVQRAQQRTAFTTGAQGKNIGNLNTAVVHLDQYHEVMKAQANGTFTPGNQIYNWAAQKFGAAAVTNPNFVRQSLAGEAASALKGNATDPEIAHILSTLDANASPSQQEGTALEGLKLLGTKLNTYDEQYHQISPDDPWSPVLPSAKAVFQRYGVSPLARSAGAPAPAATPGPAAPKGAAVTQAPLPHVQALRNKYGYAPSN